MATGDPVSVSVTSTVAAEVRHFEETFDGLVDEFQILDKVGEGTFSCVYKAIDLKASSPSCSIVAVKKIHATSSPARIKNELEILAALHSSEHICSVVTARRCRDQVIVVMPYIEFTDFRTMYMDCSIEEMRIYMRQLLQALDFTASRGVIHRDVKPTNFLYCRTKQRGILVDFGLAEFYIPENDSVRSKTSHNECVCVVMGQQQPQALLPLVTEAGYRKDDIRPARRANRAGTRGFRAPEVLLKCSRQSPKIDVWAAGVVLLMMLTHKFPFFTSLDDADALVELATIFGRREMRAVAALHGAEFETNLHTINDSRYSWQQIVDWCNERSRKFSKLAEEKPAIELLDSLMEPNSAKRPTAGEALQHRFFAL